MLPGQLAVHFDKGYTRQMYPTNTGSSGTLHSGLKANIQLDVADLANPSKSGGISSIFAS